MKTIYKYQFKTKDHFTLEMPAYSEILDVKIQNGVPTMWAMVDTKEPKTTIDFTICGTGQPLPEHCHEYSYIMTYFEGPYVWHLFGVNNN